MELFFLGTSAGVPTRTRNVTSILLDLQHPTRGGLWMFDCGEGTQHQLLRTAAHPGKLDKIFITHLHGDHLFGLPGLLCSRSMAGNIQPLTIYGPPGIREFVETSLRISGSWTDYPLEIIEIKPGVVFKDDAYTVTAAALNHPVECYGFRIEERDKPGALDGAALIAAGVPFGPLFQQLKRGESVTLEDGRTINGAAYLSPPRPGKKLALFGDTAPCDNALALAQGVDLLVHEATLEVAMEEKANSRGHSSTHQAARLARDAQVKKLIVTHVSSRYDAEGCAMLLAECCAIFAASELAEDFATVRV
ncbi:MULTISPECIES: ribonuclease Z [Leclercia]|jgi:ribonuclease Z|uniref:ribonuclease Z n=1 Tax=Leclercia TaxID=83654 RepID=UPI000CD11332|nr:MULTISPECIES: ribonuclease Z [Leclercia]POV36585.1 ribonuclease Z [Leclercia sp. LSNIH5]POW68471.1 ribonuclease Z [Leclercia sp. LSNIH2]AUU86291.1 ribonuclease Z [Leclercia sp. LSNIH1]MCZ7838206.1 ribonuclease Z [Leclercia adecarboxylata]QGW17923.1 ribonuclease Z [Leclercia sp. Colony189]